MPTTEEWRQRWREGDTAWDLNGVTPPLVNWSKTNDPRGLNILTPGCGRGYDAHFLAKRGAGVTAVDIVPEAVAAARAQHPDSPVTWETADVITLDRPGAYDRIWEYTCFCALEPDLRADYLANMARLLKPGGVFWGLVKGGEEDGQGPPYNIAAQHFRDMLEVHFEVTHLVWPAPDSIKARRGVEIWFEARKPLASTPTAPTGLIL